MVKNSQQNWFPKISGGARVLVFMKYEVSFWELVGKLLLHKLIIKEFEAIEASTSH